MKKAVLTKKGAEKFGKPELAGEVVRYEDDCPAQDGYSPLVLGGVYYGGTWLGDAAFGGDEPILVRIEE